MRRRRRGRRFTADLGRSATWRFTAARVDGYTELTSIRNAELASVCYSRPDESAGNAYTDELTRANRIAADYQRQHDYR